MTNQEAIKILDEYKHCFWDKLYEPICMAIKALEQEPTIGQLFSCEEVEELLKKIWKQVEQEPKTGHWIEEYIGCMYDVCSECGQKVTTGHFKYNFCPHCGARMVKPQESEEV